MEISSWVLLGVIGFTYYAGFKVGRHYEADHWAGFTELKNIEKTSFYKPNPVRKLYRSTMGIFWGIRDRIRRREET